MLKLDWAEPGDPPNADYKSVRAKPLAKPIKYDSLTSEIELELVRRYREDGDLDALDQLVGAHRPMVVRMTMGRWRGNGTSLAALVEYGMFGVRRAAEPPRPSETKKGKLVGFNSDNGNRFSTYARSYAAKEMRAAASFDPSPDRSEELEAKADIAKASWWDREELEENDDPSDDDDKLISADGHKVLYRHDRHRRPYQKPSSSWALWQPHWAKDQYKRKVKPRNFIKHSRTKTELTNLDAHQARYRAILKAYEAIAEGGMKGWVDGNVDALWSDAAHFMVASLDRSPAFTGKEFRLPKEVLLKRWKLGCDRLGYQVPFKLNAGLGLFDKHGHMLPDFTFLIGKVTRLPRKGTKRVSFLCLRPLASIYYMRGEDSCEIISRRRYRGPEEEQIDNLAFREFLPMERQVAQQYSDKIILSAPRELVEALNTISRRKLTTRSAYIRQAVLAQLEKDGVCPTLEFAA